MSVMVELQCNSVQLTSVVKERIILVGVGAELQRSAD